MVLGSAHMRKILGTRLCLAIDSPDPNIVKIGTTILAITRALHVPAKSNTLSITTPPKEEVVNIDSAYGFWRLCKVSKKHFTPDILHFKEYLFSCSNGPNGHATYTALVDLDTLDRVTLGHIFTVGGPTLKSRMETLQTYSDQMPSEMPRGSIGSKLRKVVSIPDREAKTREIAILDY
jgi:hypothetical protein